MKPIIFFTFILSLTIANASMEEKTIRYSLGETEFESTVVWDGEDDDARPGILMVPNWMGPTENSLEKAKKIADDGFVVMMVDMYGVGTRPQNASEAGEAAGYIRSNRDIMRTRSQSALALLRAQAETLPLLPDQIAAIGFCFGGGTVLELGRTGANLAAIVSFHGDLLSPTLKDDAGKTTAKVLVLHGAADPYVPQAHVQEFISTMLETEVDWQLVQYANTVHSFTDPTAASPGQAEYNPTSAMRAMEAMEELFEEVFEESADN